MRIFYKMKMGWLLTAGMLVPSVSQAYPSFIRHEYTSCTICHLSPRGGGMLTDYGQGIAGSMSLFPVDYQGPPQTAFYKSVTLSGVLTHGSQFRLMRVHKEGKKPATFPMQADYMNSARISEKIRFDTTIGVHVRRNASGSVDLKGSMLDRLALRKAMAAYRYRDDAELSFGRDALAIGLNVDDHTIFTRSKNRRGVVDYATQLRWDFWDESAHHTPFIFAPSGEESIKNYEWGLGYRLEKYLSNRFAVGGTVVFGRSSAISRELLGAFTRWSPIDRWAVLAEYDWTYRQSPGSGGRPFFHQHVLYLRPSYEIHEWLEIGWVAEFYTRTHPFFERTIKHGLSAYGRINRQFTAILDARDALSVGLRERTVAFQIFAHL